MTKSDKKSAGEEQEKLIASTRSGGRLLRAFASWLKVYAKANDAPDWMKAVEDAAFEAGRVNELCSKYDEAVAVLFAIEHISMPDMYGEYCPYCTDRIPGHKKSCALGEVLAYFRSIKEEEKRNE